MSVWQTSLATLERLRSRIVASGDHRAAQRFILVAAAFARMMVNTSVPVSEQWLHQYVTGGKRPEFHAKWLIAIEDFALDGVDAIGFLQLSDWQQWRILTTIPGLGPAKAAMAVGLMGGQLACIDRHVYAYFNVKDSTEVVEEYKRDVTLKNYQTLHRRFFGGWSKARDTQWRLFERQVPSFADSGHWVYFDLQFQQVGL